MLRLPNESWSHPMAGPFSACWTGNPGKGREIGWVALHNGWSEVQLELDRASIVPVYRQIYERLREQILAGALPETSRLPPERAFARRLNVNRSTVVHAYRELAADGLIEQRVGSGSRVVA